MMARLSPAELAARIAARTGPKSGAAGRSASALPARTLALTATNATSSMPLLRENATPGLPEEDDPTVRTIDGPGSGRGGQDGGSADAAFASLRSRHPTSGGGPNVAGRADPWPPGARTGPTPDVGRGHPQRAPGAPFPAGAPTPGSRPDVNDLSVRGPRSVVRRGRVGGKLRGHRVPRALHARAARAKLALEVARDVPMSWDEVAQEALDLLQLRRADREARLKSAAHSSAATRMLQATIRNDQDQWLRSFKLDLDEAGAPVSFERLWSVALDLWATKYGS